jgi:hypothetical protein
MIINHIKGKKVAIDGIVGHYSDRITSHKGSWPNMQKSKLRYLGVEDVKVLTKKDDINDFDVWLISLPMEFKGTFNLFGGANDELAENLARLVDFQGDIYIMDSEMPDIGEFILSRKKSCSDLFSALDEEEFTELSEDIEMLDLTLSERGATGFILGDSHSVSVYRPGFDISRNDGKTLYGVLKEGLKEYVPIGTEHLITYFGNIDVRHHLMRQPDLVKSVNYLVDEYERQLLEFAIPEISIVALLWIEDESRKLPKTGYYEGTPFFGSALKRSILVDIINAKLYQKCKLHGWNFLEWPQEMKVNGLLDFKYMEKPKSVHLSREWYHFDFETNKSNEKFFSLK